MAGFDPISFFQASEGQQKEHTMRDSIRISPRRVMAATILILVAVWVSGCVRSLTPFYTPDQVVQKPEWNGEWQLLKEDGSPKGQKPWTFSQGQVLTFSEKGIPGVLKVVYFKIGDTLFADSSAGDLEGAPVNEWWAFHVAPVHFVSKVVQKESQISFTALNIDWLKAAAAAGEWKVSSIKMAGDMETIFQATPEQWTQILEKAAQDPKAFPVQQTITLKRMPAAEK